VRRPKAVIGVELAKKKVSAAQRSARLFLPNPRVCVAEAEQLHGEQGRRCSRRPSGGGTI
jgi:tRNA/tmRNA/rRNA uracil-C5-methylase (TrmA/RlmC/RlmD family)